MNNIEEKFREAANEGGIHFDAPVISDDQIHRAHGIGHKSGSKNIAYRFNGAIGWIMCNKTGAFVKFSANGKRVKLSPADLEEIKRAKAQRQKELDETHRQAAQKASKLCKGAIYADSNNEYCYRKNIQPHGCKTIGSGSLKGVLIVPIFDANNKLVNLQFIQPDGTKRFLSGGKKKGCFFTIGDHTETILIAEGFATAASLFEYHGLQTYIAFDAGNLEPVAKVIRAKHPGTEIIVCGDHDLSGVGQTKARAAALAIGGKYMIPPTPGNDWNDEINAAKAPTCAGVRNE